MSWNAFIKAESEKLYYKEIERIVSEDAKKHNVFPPHDDMFNAFKCTNIDNVKTVILAQDPYHHQEQAHGLSFSVPKDVSIPPSLRNIYRELNTDIGFKIPKHGNLISWAKQGVLLLNSALTVIEGDPGSHLELWKPFTDAVIGHVNEIDRPIVFLLWGAHARSKKKLLTNEKHLVIEGSHPSPLSAHTGFFGGKYFSRTNEFLVKNGIEPIDWSIK